MLVVLDVTQRTEDAATGVSQLTKGEVCALAGMDISSTPLTYSHVMVINYTMSLIIIEVDLQNVSYSFSIRACVSVCVCVWRARGGRTFSVTAATPVLFPSTKSL